MGDTRGGLIVVKLDPMDYYSHQYMASYYVIDKMRESCFLTVSLGDMYKPLISLVWVEYIDYVKTKIESSCYTKRTDGKFLISYLDKQLEISNLSI